jgi:recombination protein RecA
MSSVVITPLNTSPALASSSASALRAHIESSLGEHLSSTLQLRERAVPLTVSTGIAALDALTGGLPRGALSEIAGPASSGRTGVMLAALAGATCRQEVCALVDASDSFDPASAAAAGVDLDRLLWVRCNQRSSASLRQEEIQRRSKSWGTGNGGFTFAGVLEQVLKVADLLLQSGGLGMVVLDLGNIPGESVRRVPLTSWFRFRRAVEPTSTVLLLIEQESCVKTCASLVLQLRPESVCASTASSEAIAVQHGLEFSRRAVRPLVVRNRDQIPQPWVVSSTTSIHQAPEIPENNGVSHAALFRGMRFRADLVRAWAQRRPPQSSGVGFELRTAL